MYDERLDALLLSGFDNVRYATSFRASRIGLRLVEPPSLFRPERMDADEMLAEGMTVCIEPSTAVEVVGLKEEEQYVVTATGVRQLTKTAVEGRAT